jgi:hypothetical protein
MFKGKLKANDNIDHCLTRDFEQDSEEGLERLPNQLFRGFDMGDRGLHLVGTPHSAPIYPNY